METKLGWGGEISKSKQGETETEKRDKEILWKIGNISRGQDSEKDRKAGQKGKKHS